MNWPLFLLLVPTLSYVGQCMWFALHGDPAMAVVFAGYAVANCGFLPTVLR